MSLSAEQNAQVIALLESFKHAGVAAPEAPVASEPELVKLRPEAPKFEQVKWNGRSAEVSIDEMPPGRLAQHLKQQGARTREALAPFSASHSVKTPGYEVLKAWPLIVLAVLLCGLVYWLAPVKLTLMAYGLAKGVVFAIAGAISDYLLFPDDAPEALSGVAQGTAWKRRALIVAAFLIIAAMLP